MFIITHHKWAQGTDSYKRIVRFLFPFTFPQINFKCSSHPTPQFWHFLTDKFCGFIFRFIIFIFSFNFRAVKRTLTTNALIRKLRLAWGNLLHEHKNYIYETKTTLKKIHNTSKYSFQHSCVAVQSKYLFFEYSHRGRVGLCIRAGNVALCSSFPQSLFIGPKLILVLFTPNRGLSNYPWHGLTIRQKWVTSTCLFSVVWLASWSWLHSKSVASAVITNTEKQY